MAQETTEKIPSKIKMPRATQPVSARMLPRSAMNTTESRRMSQPLDEDSIFTYLRNVAHAYRVVKQMRCRRQKRGCLFGYTKKDDCRSGVGRREPRGAGAGPKQVC
jgi:hypothetical protein